MATNDFLPFAGGAGANVLTQAEYEALSALASGFQSGILPSSNLNKVLRQASIMSAMLAQWIADNSGDNVVDDGTTATIESSLTAALAALGLRAASTAQTGVVQLADAATAQALTDAAKVLTPATLKAAGQGSNQSLAANGYQKLPGGLILEWGTVTTDATGAATWTLPIAFPNAFLHAFGTFSSSVRTPYVVNIGAATTTSVPIFLSSTAGAAVAGGIHAFAIGY